MRELRVQTAAAFALLVTALWIEPRLVEGQTLEPPKPAPASSAPVQVTAANPPWGRIVIVGASALAGFVESEPFGGPKTSQCRLSRYVDAALIVTHEPVRNLANAMLFMQPEVFGRQQLDEALKPKPTLVIGLDFLFWFCYGDGNTSAERLQRFERGLKLLEAVQCPLILGDIPDASGASESMLTPDQIPSAQTMAAANRRLKKWAATRKQVVVLPLSTFMRTAVANRAVTVHGHTVPAGKTRALLQSDRLHPGPLGCAVLALTALDAFQAARPGSGQAEIRWDPDEVTRLILNASPGHAANRQPQAPAGKM